MTFELMQLEKDKSSKEQDLTRIITEQKLRIESLITDIECNERSSKQSINALNSKLEHC